MLTSVSTFAVFCFFEPKSSPNMTRRLFFKKFLTRNFVFHFASVFSFSGCAPMRAVPIGGEEPKNNSGPSEYPEPSEFPPEQPPAADEPGMMFFFESINKIHNFFFKLKKNLF